MLAGILTGAPINSESALGILANNYVFDHMRVRWEVVALLIAEVKVHRDTGVIEVEHAWSAPMTAA